MTRRDTILCAISLMVAWVGVPVNSRGEAPKTKPAPKNVLPETRFWKTGIVDAESVLFLAEEKGPASVSLLLVPKEIVAVKSASGLKTYEPGKDFIWKKGTRQVILPKGSSIVSKKASDLRRPPGSQKYKLLHRDGGDEIFLGTNPHEYHDMQTTVTYRYTNCDLKLPEPLPNCALPHTRSRLLNDKELNIAIHGDSISVGGNASGWANVPPRQPAYPEAVRKALAETFAAKVNVDMLAVAGGKSTAGLSTIDKVISGTHSPDLVVIAFGMNDASSVQAKVYESNIKGMIDAVRAAHPHAEFVLVSSMLPNPDLVMLKQELFPQYRDGLERLCGEGVVLADVTGVWSEMHKRKRHCDLTGNGINHPNDFGHAIYTQQVLAALAKGMANAAGK
jgi:acyl-CoA thioesterase-1